MVGAIIGLALAVTAASSAKTCPQTTLNQVQPIRGLFRSRYSTSDGFLLESTIGSNSCSMPATGKHLCVVTATGRIRVRFYGHDVEYKFPPHTTATVTAESDGVSCLLS